jgi:hypothetical protein
MDIQLITFDDSLLNTIKKEALATREATDPDYILGLPRKKDKGLGAINTPDVIVFTFNIITAIGTKVLASWIWELIKEKHARIKIEGKECKSKESIESILQNVRPEVTNPSKDSNDTQYT